MLLLTEPFLALKCDDVDELFGAASQEDVESVLHQFIALCTIWASTTDETDVAQFCLN